MVRTGASGGAPAAAGQARRPAPSTATLQTILKAGRMPNGTPLTPEQRANIIAQLKQRHEQVRGCTARHTWLHAKQHGKRCVSMYNHDEGLTVLLAAHAIHRVARGPSLFCTFQRRSSPLQARACTDLLPSMVTVSTASMQLAHNMIICARSAGTFCCHTYT